ncbi:hypothetical protein QAD02_001641 [Eretmocerus hayati]|nr:hypothetical protein QAD02_001641 [Eretmocerus hayati]
MLVPKAPIQCEDVSQEPEGSERESMDPNYFYPHILNIFRNDLQQLRLEIKDVLNVGSHCKCFGCIIAKTLQESHLKSGGAMDPKHIRDRIMDICKSMRLGRQEDAHEFFSSLLQTMNVYLATEFDVPAKDQPYHITPVDQIFGGCTMTGFKCTSCSHVVKRFDNTLVRIQDNPGKWSPALKDRMTKVAVAAGWSLNLGLPPAYTAAFAALSFGLVNLDWYMLALLCGLLYGWRMKQPFVAAGSAILAYWHAFGRSPF